MPFTPPPTPPSTSDPANFDARADALVAWYPTNVAELNAFLNGTMPAVGQRAVLTGPVTYYVRPDGNDSNSGLLNTAAGAFKTLQQAINVATGLDFAGNTVTIQLADGTYAAANVFRPWTGGGALVIKGNAATPANVHVTSAVSNAISITAACPGEITVQDMKISTTGSLLSCLVVDARTTLLFQNIDFGSATDSHVVSVHGGRVLTIGNYKITGGAAQHLYSTNQGSIEVIGRTVTLVGTPAFTVFAYAVSLALLNCSGNTFTGSATGTRYSAVYNSLIYSAGATLPGNVAGSTSAGGQYV